MDLKTLIEIALEEDLGAGDITTDHLIDSRQIIQAKIEAKQDLVLAGLDIAHKVFTTIDKGIEWKPHTKDGMSVSKGDCIASINGKAASILKAERVALNFLQHLSGIATLTRQFVKAIAKTPVKILDTRKTLPGWRSLEKYAVLMGGGNNHRLGLFDRYLIKNNHIDIVGAIMGAHVAPSMGKAHRASPSRPLCGLEPIAKAIEKILENKKSNILVEVEVRNLEELKTALNYPVDIIMLDNFTLSQIRKALDLGRGKVQFEVSGGITLANVKDYAETGVDFISTGTITHSAPAADLHLVIA